MNNKLPPLYSLTAIGIATFLGSALAGGYMLAVNYAALGKRRFGMQALYGSIILVICLVIAQATLFNTPQLAILLTIGQVLLVLLLTQKLQGPMFATYEEMGGKYYSNWRAVLVGFIASIVLATTSILFVLMFGGPVPAPAS